MKLRDIMNENLPRSTKGMTTDDEIYTFFASSGGYKEPDPDILEKITNNANFIKRSVSPESWKSVLTYMKKAATYQAAHYTLNLLADVLRGNTKGILVKDLKLGLANLISNGELVIRGSRAFKTN